MIAVNALIDALYCEILKKNKKALWNTQKSPSEYIKIPMIAVYVIIDTRYYVCVCVCVCVCNDRPWNIGHYQTR